MDRDKYISFTFAAAFLHLFLVFAMTIALVEKLAC